jgi:uncharacterized protein YndB with AHSA1/START domain
MTSPSAPQQPAPDPGRVIDVSVDVPGTPEQVWQAIATGPGISSWYIPHEVEERTGGAVAMDFGSFGTLPAEVVAYEPPHRIVITGGERPLAHEWTVQARGDGTCRVRLVNSGFGSGEDWDAEYDGMSEGWPLFLENLRLHCTHFPGRQATALTPMAMAPGPHTNAWAGLCRRLGVAPELDAGDEFATSGDGVPPVRGRVAKVRRTGRTTAYLLVLDEPVPATGFVAAEGQGDVVALSFYQYRYAADPLPDEWTPLLAAWYPAPEPVD